MRYIDSHMHFWDQAVLASYTWLAEVPAISARHDPAVLHAEAGAELPEKIVFVEAGAPPLPEVRWVEELTVTEPRIRAIVAKIAIDAGPRTTADLAELRRHPLVRGVRHPFEHDPADYCARPAFIRGVREAGTAGFSFDLCGKHPQLPAIIELVRQCPETSFVLDHGGKPGIRAGLLDPWARPYRPARRFPECRVQAVGASSPRPTTWAGPKRSSNPTPPICWRPSGQAVCFSAATGRWPNWHAAICGGLELARRFTAHLAPAEKAAIFVGNAERIYRI